MTQLIAIDTELVATLQATLEASRQELVRLRETARGQAPFTLKQAAAYLHVSYPTLKEYIRNGAIVPSEYGSRVWVTQKELDSFIARHRRKS